jgi:anaphase-promoting complex subunit 10
MLPAAVAANIASAKLADSIVSMRSGAMSELLPEDEVAFLDPATAEELIEIGGDAVWSLSTAKPGFGAEQLRDGNLDTYWQSDGVQPHCINIQLPKKRLVSQIHLYLDFEKDESYTPARLAVRAGSSFHDLIEIIEEKFSEPPTGWVVIPLHDPGQTPIHACFIQISILAMHQNGRDTHVRQARIFGPHLSVPALLDFPLFHSPLCTRAAILR